MELLQDLINNATALAVVMAPIITIFVQLIKKSNINKKLLPYVSMGIGLVIGLVFAMYLQNDLFLYGFAGILSGAGASGIYDAIKSAKG